ncbi:serine/threonine protein kinase [Streptomyces sp. NBC_01537]|uniref:serine/threonine-protein kinase n=1 Tax=Streptomyces sp. NBC_01537 TaxID=2903896 RepID=UPI00386755D9
MTPRLLAGRYRVIEELGKGGMGTVCRALDEELGREVAVKELRTFSDATGPDLALLWSRMRREARAAARIRHAGVIAVYDVADHEGSPVIVMELVDGPSLADLLQADGTVDPLEAARIGAQVADALAAAHAVGVLHRDVKPGNILLGRGGRVVLTDFGIATVDDPGDGYPSRLTHTGVLVGSLEYMAPERAQGDDPGPPSDIWSLGAALYAAVEGSSPFQRTSTWTTLTAIVTEPLPASRRCGPLLPVLRRLMDKDPKARPDAAEAAQLLAALCAAEPGSAVAVREPAPSLPVAPEAEPAAQPASAAQPLPAEPGTSGSDTVPNQASGRARGARRRRTVVALAAAGGVLAAAGATLAFVVGGGGDAPAGTRVAGGLNAADPQVRSSSAVTASASASPSGSASPSSGTGAGAADSPGTTAAPTDRATATDAAPGGPVAATSASAEPAPTSAATTTAPAADNACTDAGGGTYDCTVIKAANSFDDDRTKVGVVYKGTRAFYCQADVGISRTRAGVTSTWWAKTDDDSGNSGVWITVTVISGAVDNTPLSGLPTC